MKSFLTQSQTRQLLHNKFVVILGGSVQRSMYKDLVLLLQRDQYLTLPQLKSKGEFSFEQDVLVEGGRLGPMTNGTEYREVRQYRSDHHLLRFYFVTRIYSPYMESILEDFRRGLKPDVVIISSCVWDITRYGQNCLEEYKENLDKFFGQIKTIIYRKCLLLWCLAMPIGQTIKGGFLVPEVSHLGATLCYDIIEANFFGGSLAEAYGFDVLDLHFHFRFSLQHRMPDGVHWDTLAHRRVSSLLLQHIADAWGVDLHDPFTRPAQEPYQRCEPVQYQQSYRSDRFQLLPPNSDRTETIRPPLVRMLPPNQPAQTAGCHHGAVDPAMHYPQQLLRQQNSGVRPPRGRRFAAAGNWRLSSQNLPPDDLWLSQWDYPPVRDACSQMDSSSGGGFRIRPHFQTDDNYKRRRRRRTNIRTHPYPPHLPQIRLRCASERFLLRDPLGAIGRVDQRSDGDGQPTQPLVLRDELRGAQGILGREEDRSEQMQTVSPRPPGSSSVTPETPPRGTQSPTKTSAEGSCDCPIGSYY